jgi:aldose 1-epimerase
MNDSLNPYFGATIGRVTNRISNAEFKLNGVTYNLDKNNAEHCLHGGKQSFARVIFAHFDILFNRF